MPPSRSVQKKRWTAPLLLVNLSLFLFETITGFILFFIGALLTDSNVITFIHSWAGVVLIATYAVYQWNHYLRVQHLKGKFHYTLGVFTFLSLLIVIVSGLPLMSDNFKLLTYATTLNLVHVVSSFAFLIFLSGHLVVVWKVTKMKF